MEWVRGDSIGCGSFSKVDLAIPIEHGSQKHPLMAVKSCDASCSASLMNEKSILNELTNCREIICCFGDGFTSGKGVKLYNILLEYASGGSLADKLKNLGKLQSPESEARRYAKSILKGIRFIHKKGFVHCDIKLQNILVFPSESGGDDQVKIADFGLAKKAGKKDRNSRGELRGTLLYMSPEMIAEGEQEKPADIWAFGCIVVEMLTGAPAWSCSDLAGLLMRIGIGEEVPEIPREMSEEGKDFLGKCFVKDPRQRWTAEMLLNHPFFVDDGDDHEKSNVSSTSPRTLFDFPDWASSHSSLTFSASSSFSSPEYSPESFFTSRPEMKSFLTSPAERILQLVSNHRQKDWSVSSSWMTVR